MQHLIKSGMHVAESKGNKMKIKGLVDEDFLQYKEPTMFIITSYCSFKCEKESGCIGLCQNSSLSKLKIYNIDDQKIVDRFLSNPITKAVVFGGLEPFDQKEELYKLIKCFRKHTECDIVIYTGYTESELVCEVEYLKQFSNIIVKFGRYIPTLKPAFDKTLGVELASNNQYAKKIS